MTPVIEVMRDHPFLAELDAGQLNSLADCAHETAFASGAPLFNEGEEARFFHLIRTGTVALQTAAPHRTPATFRTLHEGDFVGVSWLVPPYRWMFDARALTDVAAIAFDAACMRGKCEADHDLGYALMLRFVPALIQRMTSARLQALDLYGDRS